MCRTAISERRSSESGFTLAGLIVILTVIAIIIAYTVPTQWSLIMKREREKQTIYVMRQYARAIYEWNRTKGALPTSMDQLKEARLPRVFRGGPKGEIIDPLTGKVDWILIPPGAVTMGPAGVPNPNTPQPRNPAFGGTQTTGTQPVVPGSPGSQQTVSLNVEASPADYVGPFVGVRSPAKGSPILTFRDADNYSGWFYTVQDLQLQIALETQLNPNRR